MLWTLLVLFLFPAWASASCGTHRVQYYDLLIRDNRYPEALRLVLKDLKATPEEQKRFKIMPYADDDKQEPLSIAPSVLQSGKSDACQQAASVLERLHNREEDRRRLAAYHEEWIAAQTGWVGCDTLGKNLNVPAEAAKTAYRCLENSSLVTHQAAIEIRSIQAKRAAGDVPRLRDEDVDALQQQLRLFQEGWAVLEDKSTDSYYLPEIKREDRQSFCRATTYTRQTLNLKNEETASWQRSCHQLGLEKK